MASKQRLVMLSSFLGRLKDVISDQRGISSVEYSTLSGLVSGATWVIGDAINEAALESARRMAIQVNP